MLFDHAFDASPLTAYKVTGISKKLPNSGLPKSSIDVETLWCIAFKLTRSYSPIL